MMGQLIGNLINVVLDPIFILTLHLNVKGAAIATVIGNFIGAGYYILYFLRGESRLSVSPRDFTVKEKVLTSVLAIGIPASLGALLMSVSQMVVNGMMTAYGDMAVAGYGVASKANMIVGTFGLGLGQGVAPLLGYSFGREVNAAVWLCAVCCCRNRTSCCSTSRPTTWMQKALTGWNSTCSSTKER